MSEIKLSTKKDIKDLKIFFSNLIRKMNTNLPYSDILLIKKSALVITKDKKTISIDNTADFGLKIRVFDGEMFHERFTSKPDKETINSLAKELSALPTKKRIKIEKGKIINKNFYSSKKNDPSKLSLKIKVDTCIDVFKRLMKKSKRIINARIIYKEKIDERIFVSEKKKLYQKVTGCNFIILPIIITREGESRYHYHARFAQGFGATRFTNTQVNNLVKLMHKIIKAKKIKPGKYDCILHPVVTGLLAHESFGHGMEADTLYKGRALASKYLNKKIAPSYVTIADSPTHKNTNGSFFFDDEGCLADETVMLKCGKVNQPLTDLYSAIKMNIPKTANGRCESYDHKAYARMTATYFKPGKTPKSKMFAGVKNGIYIFGKGGGMEDPKGWGVQLHGMLGQEIKNGKLTNKLYYGVGITGYLPEILNNIKAASTNFEIPGTGFCGKGHKEWVNVAEGGCYLLIKNLELA